MRCDVSFIGSFMTPSSATHSKACRWDCDQKTSYRTKVRARRELGNVNGMPLVACWLFITRQMVCWSSSCTTVTVCWDGCSSIVNAELLSCSEVCVTYFLQNSLVQVCYTDNRSTLEDGIKLSNLQRCVQCDSNSQVAQSLLSSENRLSQ